MHSTLTPKPNDDPHDVVVVAPDAVRVAPSDDALASLLREAARIHSGAQTRAAGEVPAGPTVPPVDTMVPPVDTTFRSTAVGDGPVSTGPRSMVRRVVRAFIALLLAAGIGGAALAWRSYGDTAKKQFTELTTRLALTSSTPAESSEPPAQPAALAVAPAASNATSSPAAPPAQAATEVAAPTAAALSADSTQLQSVTSGLASVMQEVDQLKATIEQLKASQQQMSRDLAKASEARASETRASEPNLRPRITATAPRSAAAPVRRPMPGSSPRQAATAPVLPHAAAPYVARQSEPPPLAAGEELTDSELASVPRPPMPLR